MSNIAAKTDVDRPEQGWPSCQHCGSEVSFEQSADRLGWGYPPMTNVPDDGEIVSPSIRLSLHCDDCSSLNIISLSKMMVRREPYLMVAPEQIDNNDSKTDATDLF